MLSKGWLTCEVGVVRRVNEVVRQWEHHVFILVQLLRRNDTVLLSAQIPCKAFNRNLACDDKTFTYLEAGKKNSNLKYWFAVVLYRAISS